MHARGWPPPSSRPGVRVLHEDALCHPSSDPCLWHLEGWLEDAERGRAVPPSVPEDMPQDAVAAVPPRGSQKGAEII